MEVLKSNSISAINLTHTEDYSFIITLYVVT